MATILLVDDLTATRSALRRVLERAGHGVIEDPELGWVIDPPSPLPSNSPFGDEGSCCIGDADLIADLQREFPDIKIVAVSADDASASKPRAYDSFSGLPAPLAIARLPLAFEKVLGRWH